MTPPCLHRRGTVTLDRGGYVGDCPDCNYGKGRRGPAWYQTLEIAPVWMQRAWNKQKERVLEAASAGNGAHKDSDVFVDVSVEAVDPAEERETLGRIVREAWIGWADTQPEEVKAAKPHWFVPYDELDEPDKEADRLIGEAVYAYAWERFFNQGGGEGGEVGP